MSIIVYILFVLIAVLSGRSIVRFICDNFYDISKDRITLAIANGAASGVAAAILIYICNHTTFI